MYRHRYCVCFFLIFGTGSRCSVLMTHGLYRGSVLNRMIKWDHFTEIRNLPLLEYGKGKTGKYPTNFERIETSVLVTKNCKINIIHYFKTYIFWVADLLFVVGFISHYTLYSVYCTYNLYIGMYYEHCVQEKHKKKTYSINN